MAPADFASPVHRMHPDAGGISGSADLLSLDAAQAQLALAASGTGLWTWDLLTDRLEWSAECYRIHGVSPHRQPRRARDFLALVHRADRERMEHAVRTAVEQRTLYECEFRIVRPSGETVWVQNRGRATWDSAGRPVCLMGTMVELNGRRVAEEAEHERATQRAFRTLSDAAQVASERIQLALDAGAIIGTWVWEVPIDRFVADERFARSFGLDPTRCAEGLPVKTTLDSIHPDDQPMVRQAVRQALARGGAYRCEYRVRCSDGHYCWVEANGRVELGPDGMPLRFPGILIDIEDRRRAESERDAAYELLRTLMETVPGLVYAKDDHGRLRIVNQAMAAVIGRHPRDAIGLATAQYLSDPHQAAAIDANDARIMSSGRPEMVEEAMRLPGGELSWWLSSKAPTREAGVVNGVVGVSIDITERKRSIEAIQQRERELQTLADTIPDIVAWFDRELRHVFVNAAVERTTGRTRSDFLGRTHRELGFPDAYCDHWQAALHRVFATRRGADVEFDYPTPEGVRSFAARLAPEIGLDGRVDHVIAIVSDVTEQRAAQQALRDESRRKDEFLATLAHEWRNHLAPVRNSVLILQRRGTSRADDLRPLEVLDRQVSHLARLVDDLLDVASIGQGKVRLDRRDVDLCSVIETAIEASRPMLDAAGHLLEVHLPMVPLIVRADSTRLVQVFVNLINNAAKYTPPGGQVFVRAEADGVGAVVTVSDNGIGIPADMQAKVFDLFTQVNREGSHRQAGLGIGLSVVKRLVDLHGGMVDVTSQGPGKGSCFTVRLPFAGG